MNRFICFGCKEDKPEDEFYKSSILKQDYRCKKCSVKRGNEDRLRRFTENPSHEKYLYAKSSCRLNKKPFMLTEEEYSEISSKPCFYCDLPVTSYGIGLDRIDNDKSIGYTVDNVLPCCGDCNRLRGDRLTVEETVAAVKAVLELRKSKNM